MEKDAIISLLEEMKHNAENAHNYEDPKRKAKAQALDAALLFVKNAGRDDQKTIRRQTLEKAIKCVCGERENEYGSPEDNFKTIAKMWNAYLGMEAGITATDVAMMMALLKIARIATGTAKEDSFADLAGYAACGAEIAARKEKEND